MLLPRASFFSCAPRGVRRRGRFRAPRPRSMRNRRGGAEARARRAVGIRSGSRGGGGRGRAGRGWRARACAVDVPALVDPAEDVQDRRADPRDRARSRAPPAAARRGAGGAPSRAPRRAAGDEGHAAVAHRRSRRGRTRPGRPGGVQRRRVSRFDVRRSIFTATYGEPEGFARADSSSARNTSASARADRPVPGDGTGS